MPPATKERNPALAVALAAVALALLLGLPFVIEPPETTEDLVLTAIAALVLAAILVMGVVSFIRHRRPRPFLDSMLPPRPRREHPKSDPAKK